MSLVRTRLDPFQVLRFPNTYPWPGWGVHRPVFFISVHALTQTPTPPPPQLIKSGGHVIAEQLLKVTIDTYLTLTK